MSDIHMDKAAREKARELCEKATPGPWEIIVGGPASQTQVWRDGAQDQFICDCGDFEIAGSGPEDARFISAARTLLPHTLDALDAADSDNARLQVEIANEREAIASEATRYALSYPQSSDGRNTFAMFAEWIKARK